MQNLLGHTEVLVFILSAMEGHGGVFKYGVTSSDSHF